MPHPESLPCAGAAPAPGKKMERGWTGEKGLPGKLRRQTTTRSATPSAAASIPTAATLIPPFSGSICRCRVDPHSRCVDPRCHCIDPPPLHRSPPPAPPCAVATSIRRRRVNPRLTAASIPSSGASIHRRHVDWGGRVELKRREREVEEEGRGGPLYMFMIFRGHTTNIRLICK